MEAKLIIENHNFQPLTTDTNGAVLRDMQMSARFGGGKRCRSANKCALCDERCRLVTVIMFL